MHPPTISIFVLHPKFNAVIFNLALQIAIQIVHHSRLVFRIYQLLKGFELVIQFVIKITELFLPTGR